MSQDVLDSSEKLPLRRIPKGDALICEGVLHDSIFILQSGRFEVVRDGVRVIEISEPGAFMGEISALLGGIPTANVVALEDSEVRVIDNAGRAVQDQAWLTLGIARLLARRLSAVTAYLVDIKRQYADSETQLGLMDQVLGQLMASQQNDQRMGSERRDVPDY